MATGAKIKWDQEGERFVETGLSKGVFYPYGSSGTHYSNGVAWNGLSSVSETPGGAELTDIYADNIKYASLRSAETFGATIEAYTYPEEFKNSDGFASDAEAPGVAIGQQNREPFGFCYRTEVANDTATDSDDHYKLHLVYNATASPSERAYQSINESPEAITFSWEISTTPVPVTGKKPTSLIVIDSKTADADCLAALETILYGKDPTGPETADGVAPRLPLPDEVIELMTPSE